MNNPKYIEILKSTFPRLGQMVSLMMEYGADDAEICAAVNRVQMAEFDAIFAEITKSYKKHTNGTVTE